MYKVGRPPRANKRLEGEQEDQTGLLRHETREKMQSLRPQWQRRLCLRRATQTQLFSGRPRFLIAHSKHSGALQRNVIGVRPASFQAFLKMTAPSHVCPNPRLAAPPRLKVL